MEVSLVETVDGLRDVAMRLRDADRIACDIEADGLFRYRAKVCVLQLSTDTHAFVIDTLAAWDASVMQAVLGNEGPRKVIHDLSFDARLLREAGVALGNVVDTSIAARFLGEKSLGLGSLLSSRLGVTVAKDRQKQDWSRRPLQADDINYLVGDVAHLFVLADKLQADVDERGIAREVEMETEYMLQRALVEPSIEATPAWAKVKGAREQAPVVRAVLRELLSVRDAEARRHDVPPFKIVGEDSLIQASLKRPTTQDALTAVGFRGAHVRASMPHWLDAIRRGIQQGDVPPAETVEDATPRPSRAQRDRSKAREAALKAWRAQVAKARGVEIQVVLPGHCLTDVVNADINTPADLSQIVGLGAFRIERDGAALVNALLNTAPVDTARRVPT